MMLDHEYATMRRVEDAHWWYRTLRARVAADLEQAAAADGDNNVPFTILDAGCGTGGMLSWLRKKGRASWRLAGVDFSPLAVRFCQERGLESVREGDAGALPFQDESFDAVLSLDVLYCGGVEEKAAAAECHRVLRPGGVALVNCAAYDCLRGSHDTAVGGARRYSPGRLRAVLEGAGFQVARLHAWNAWIFVPIAIWRQFSRLLASRSAPDETKGDLFQLPAWANRCLIRLAAIDMALCRWFRCPLGTSLYAVAVKPPLSR